MPTPTSSQDQDSTGRTNTVPAGVPQERNSAVDGKQAAPRPARKSGSVAPSRGSGSRRAGTTGSLSDTNPGRMTHPGRRRAGQTGSLSATNPGRRRSGKTGSLSATDPRRTRSGKTGSLSATNPGRASAGRTNAGRAASAKSHDGAPQHSASKLPSTGRTVAIVAVVAVALVALLAGGFFVVRTVLHPYEGAQVEDGLSVTVEIAEGSDGQTIIQQLLDAGVIHSSKDFRRAVAAQNADQSLRSGTYTFVTGSDPADVVRQLVSGPNTTEGQLQVPEGLTIMQLSEVVEQTLGISSADFIAQAKASSYVSDYPFLKEANNDSLEGFLYPKTYSFAGRQATPDAVIRMMLDQYVSEVETLDMDGACSKLSQRYNLNVTKYDMLKIASIIEKEVGNHEDGYKVSSVIYNRLNNNMLLQSDATMMYVTGGGVSVADLRTDSPYNTYLYKGLTPTPVCSPSLTAIQEAMEPADTDYLYFLLIDDGSYSNHTFSRTLQEHEAAIAQSRAERGVENAGAATGDGTNVAGESAATTAGVESEMAGVGDTAGESDGAYEENLYVEEYVDEG